ncbi:CDP-alcohol phosphatidyltransferase family protein [Nocardioides sp. CCNWLW239]|uniref:CDP-alcohol phosphatidyltransferase family protein n=1 Tax=Nocardioides sp. CCNWLW239 TaxID=3128902 RepID=UPI00301A0BDD
MSGSRATLAAVESTVTDTSMTFAEAWATIGAAQKVGDGVPAYTRWVNRRAARVVAAAAVALGIGPNTVSFVSFGLSLAGLGALLALHTQNVLAGAIAAVLLALGYVLDSADGQVARLTGRSSKQGEWLDHVLDAARVPAIHVTVLLLATWSDSTLGVATAALFVPVVAAQFMSQILAGQLLQGQRRTTVHRWTPAGSTAKPATRSRRGTLQSVLLLPTDTGALCWVFLAWAWPPLFFALYALLFVINAGHTVASMRRRARDLARPTRQEVR